MSEPMLLQVAVYVFVFLGLGLGLTVWEFRRLGKREDERTREEQNSVELASRNKAT
ncbi:MAG: hypothetical protein ACI9W2_003567 [Gammaproteobacteria bacterium]|jgi:hypothetical protein